MTRFFPALILGFSACASLIYLVHGDWRHAGYWACAAGISFFVTA